MRFNLVGPFVRNSPFGTEIAFKKGLERLGHEVFTIDPSIGGTFDQNVDATLIFKWIDREYWNKIRTCSGAKIVYQPDDLRFPHIREMMVKMLELCDHAFTFDDDGAQLAKNFGYSNARKLLLTADDTLYKRIPNMQKDIDVCFIGSLSNGPNHKSRVEMCKVVSQIPRVKFIYMSDLYDIGKIVELYNRSKIVLNHATDVGQPFGHGYGYQCRHFEAGMTGAFVLSNVVDNENAAKDFDGGLATFDSKNHLVDMIGWYLGRGHESESDRLVMSSDMYTMIKMKHMPEHRAQEIVDYVKGIS